MRYAGGQLLAVEGGLYQWVDRYQTERQAPTRPRT
jgi:hypothetical protein